MKKNLSIGALALLAVLAFVSSARATNIIPLKPDSANGAVCTVWGDTSNSMACGKVTAPAAGYILDLTGNLYVSGAIVSGSGTSSGTAALIVSSAIIGNVTNGTVSTFTNAGNAAIAGTLTVAGASTFTGGVVGPLAINSGAFAPYVRTSAQINALTGALPRVYECSDCVNTYTLCTATGTAANQYREVGTATGCR